MVILHVCTSKTRIYHDFPSSQLTQALDIVSSLLSGKVYVDWRKLYSWCTMASHSLHQIQLVFIFTFDREKSWCFPLYLLYIHVNTYFGSFPGSMQYDYIEPTIVGVATAGYGWIFIIRILWGTVYFWVSPAIWHWNNRNWTLWYPCTVL